MQFLLKKITFLCPCLPLPQSLTMKLRALTQQIQRFIQIWDIVLGNASTSKKKEIHIYIYIFSMFCTTSFQIVCNETT